jgi:UDP-glucose:(heptosyl)LPS alpha-1,3-glucosyltransferase
MEVVFIKKKYTPFGGAEVYLKNLLSYLKNFAEIHLITTSWKNSLDLNIHQIGSTSFFLSDLTFALKVKDYLKKHFSGKQYLAFSFDRTLSQHIYRASDGCHLRWLENRFKYLGNSPVKKLFTKISPKHLQIKWLEKKCLELSEVIIVNSKMVLKDYERFYGEKITKKCKVIYNGVDLKRFYPVNKEKKLELRKKLELPLDVPLILFVGSGYERKGLKILIKSVAMLKEGMLIVIGKERSLNQFKRLSDLLGIKNRIKFLGARQDVASFYRAADVFVLPTVYDPFSNACLEAMACGLPVITTSANGASDLIEDGKNGFVVELPVDIEKLAQVIEICLSKQEEMSKAARKTAENYSIERAVKEIIEVIKSANPCN